MDDKSRFELEGWVLVDPQVLYNQCAEKGIPVEPWVSKCNSLTYPIGPEPSVGYFLVADSAQRRAAIASTVGWALYLNIYDVNGRKKRCYFYITDMRCVTPGYSGDSNSIYMITVKDYRDVDGWRNVSQLDAGIFNPVRRRKHLRKENSTGYSYTVPAYNTTSSTTPGASSAGTFSSTWASIVGTYSKITGGLPYSPASTPTDWDCNGQNFYWLCIAALDRLGCMVKYDIFDSVANLIKLTAVEMGKAATITARNTALDTLKNYLIWDYQPICTSYLSVGFRVKVIRRESNYTLPLKTAIGSNDTATLYNLDPSSNAVGLGTRIWDHDYRDTFMEPRYYAFTYSTFTDGGAGSGAVILDHDNPLMYDDSDTTTDAYASTNVWGWGLGSIIAYLTNLKASLEEHATKFLQSQLNRNPINRVYAGFHVNDALMPNGAMKIVKWSDLAGPRQADGMKTHFYAGDKYLPPHAVYHLVNPHRFIRGDDILRLPQLENIDLSKL